METYEESKTAVRTAQGLSREFEIRIGLHQGSALSPQFAIVIDVLLEHLRAEDQWELLFPADQCRSTARQTCEMARGTGKIWIES